MLVSSLLYAAVCCWCHRCCMLLLLLLLLLLPLPGGDSRVVPRGCCCCCCYCFCAGELPFAALDWDTSVLGTLVGLICAQTCRNSWSSIGYANLASTFPSATGEVCFQPHSLLRPSPPVK